MRKFCLAFLASGALAFAQLDSGSVTIAASRTITLQPDQVIFSLSVTSGLQGTLDQVAAQLAPLGITAANFLGVNTATASIQSGLRWSFRLTAPLAKIKDTIAALQGLDTSLHASFNVAGMQVSPELQASQQCSIPDLVSDARAQAQKLATAAGMTVGPVLAVANTPVGGVGVLTTIRTGDFSALFDPITGAPFPGIFVPPSQPAICSATIKFALQ